MAVSHAPCGNRVRPAAGLAFLFTLLLAALLGIALVTATELDSTLSRRAREQALLQVGHEFRQALARYQSARRGPVARLDGSGAIVVTPQLASGAVPVGGQAGLYPARLEDLLLDPRQPHTVRHLRRIYADPITGQAAWGLVREGGRIVGVYSLSTMQPIKRDGFDADDARFTGTGSYRDWVFSHPPDRALRPAGAASATERESLPAPAGFAPVPPPAPGAP